MNLCVCTADIEETCACANNPEFKTKGALKENLTEFKSVLQLFKKKMSLTKQLN